MTSFDVQKIFILNLTRPHIFFAKLYQYLRWLLKEQAPVNEKKKPSVEKYDNSDVKMTLLETNFRIHLIQLW